MPRGWIKSEEATEEKKPTIALSFQANASAREEPLMEFYITRCSDEKRPVPTLKPYLEAPREAFVFDARYLVENAPSGDRDGAMANLRALTEAYAWWAKKRVGRKVVFFCAAGQNRSVTSAVFFALSLLGETEPDNARRRGPRDPSWVVRGMNSASQELIIYEPTQGTTMSYILRLIARIRPVAFKQADAKAPEPWLDYTRLWVGHEDNRALLRLVDNALYTRLWAGWWDNARWLDYEVPPELSSARAEPSVGGKKRKELASAEVEPIEPIL